MRDLICRLEVDDGDAAGALRVIDHFDVLVEHRASVAAVVRAAAVLAGCPAGLHDAARGSTHRFAPSGHALPGAAPAAGVSAAVPGRIGSRVWLERTGDPGPLDALVVERTARAVRALTGDVGPASDEVLVKVVCDDDVTREDRCAAAGRLGLTGPTTVVVSDGDQRAGPLSARIGGAAVTLLPGAHLPSRTGRTGSAVAAGPEQVPLALARARLAFTVTDRPGGPGPSAVDHADLGVLAEIAHRFPASDAAEVEDVRRIDALLEGHPWVVDTLQAVLDRPSIRQAAALLHVHHSTLQGRVCWLEQRLGYDATAPGGRQRAAAAVLLWRIADAGR